MTNILLIGAGGFVGALTRYWFGAAIQALSQQLHFPAGTLTINVLGCLLIGGLARLGVQNAISAELRLLLITGFLGAFTTFSAFGNETVLLMQNQKSGLALLYVAASVLLGLGAIWAGQWLVGGLGK